MHKNKIKQENSSGSKRVRDKIIYLNKGKIELSRKKYKIMENLQKELKYNQTAAYF